MTDGEQKALWRGVAAGTLMGVAIGLIIALFILMKAPGAVWFPAVFFPLVLVAWWSVQELTARGRRRASPPGGRSSLRRWSGN
jgi:hypothetical protein